MNNPDLSVLIEAFYNREEITISMFKRGPDGTMLPHRVQPKQATPIIRRAVAFLDVVDLKGMKRKDKSTTSDAERADDVSTPELRIIIEVTAGVNDFDMTMQVLTRMADGQLHARDPADLLDKVKVAREMSILAARLLKSLNATSKNAQLLIRRNFTVIKGGRDC